MIRQISSTLSSSIWTSLISIILVPIYVARIGSEAYGLVGIFLTIQNLSRLFDLGIPVFLNREMARSTSTAATNTITSLMPRLEAIYWALGLLIGLALLLLAPAVTNGWLQPVSLPKDSVEHSLKLIAAITIFQWPTSFYIGALTGLQKQTLLAGLQSALGTIRALGAWAVVEAAPSITAFFLWQLAITAVSTLLLRLILMRNLPHGREAQTTWNSAFSTLRHSLPLAGIGILSIPLLQMDKIILSRTLPLNQYGRYVAVSTIATTLYLVINSVYNSALPLMSKAANDHFEGTLALHYMRGSRLMAALVLPTALCIALFPRDVLMAWSGTDTYDPATRATLALLAGATALHGLAHLLGALQIATNNTDISLAVNSVAVCICAPLLWMLTSRMGVVGAGVYALILHTAMLITHITLTHKRVLPDTRRSWVATNLAILISASAVPLCVYCFAFETTRRPQSLALLILTGIGSLVGAACACQDLRLPLIAKTRQALLFIGLGLSK